MAAISRPPNFSLTFQYRYNSETEMGWASSIAQLKGMHRPTTTFQLHRNPVENMYADKFELCYAAQDRIKSKAPEQAPATLP